MAETFTNYAINGFDLGDLREFENPDDLVGRPPFEILNVQQAVNACVRSGRFTETTSIIEIGGNPYKYLG